MKRIILFLSVLVVVSLFGYAGYFYYQNLRGVAPAIKPPTADISELIQTDNTPLILPDEFQLSIFAKDLPNARDLAEDPNGNLLVSLMSGGKVVALIDRNSDGHSDETKVLVDNLRKPHGLAFDCGLDGMCKLYIAQENKVTAYDYDIKNLEIKNEKKILDLPAGGRHTSRSLLLKDNTLFVSIGSSCDVCHEKNPLRGSIVEVDLATNSSSLFATGLRNSVFMAVNPATNKIWATDMGRDLLGDDLPPDEINIIEEGKKYGWPNCYGKNIHDTVFDKNIYIRNPCMEPFETPSHIDVSAHSAVLGLDFIPEQGWPEGYTGNLLVAFHGSWNRSVPAGYKIVRYNLDKNGNVLSSEDFLSGFIRQDGSLFGRPVDILVHTGGKIFISDDKSGVVYMVSVKK